MSSDGPLKFNLRRGPEGATLSLVRFRRHGAVSVVLNISEMALLDDALVRAKDVLAREPTTPTSTILELKPGQASQ